MSRTVASIIAGRPATDAPGGHETSTNPADTGETVADVLLGDAATFVAACEAARAAQRDSLIGALRAEERILLLPSGPRSIRFRPALTISEDELAVGIKAIGGRLDRLAAERARGTS